MSNSTVDLEPKTKVSKKRVGKAATPLIPEGGSINQPTPRSTKRCNSKDLLLGANTTSQADEDNSSKHPMSIECSPQKAYNWLIRILAAGAMVAGIRYIVWRWSRIIATSYWLSLPFALCEGCLILLGSGAFYLQTIKYRRRPSRRLSDLGLKPADLPTVDVLIPCFREPIEVIEKTVTAALAIDWPADKLVVLLLDDGGSDEAKQMIDRISRKIRIGKIKGQVPELRYVARLRKPSEPHHAKAGNLNNAIMTGNSSGDFILVLDCDMVAKASILNALMPHFYQENDPTNNKVKPVKYDEEAAVSSRSSPVLEEKVAMVQSPQAFSNVPRGDPLNNQSLLFYHVLMCGWDGWSSTPCCGTNVVFSREALTIIGGFIYGSVTEDFLTSLTLHAAGYKTKYVDEVHACGLAPDGIDSFYAQRLRWAVGGLQIFRFFNPLFKVGELTLVQRLLYGWSGGYPLLSFATALVMCTPFLFLLDNGKLLLTSGTVREYIYNFFPFYVLHTLCSLLNHARLGRIGLLYFWRSQQETAFMLFTYMRACVIVGLGLQFSFNVTRKDGKQIGDGLKDLANALPAIIFLMVGLASVVTGGLQMLESKMDFDLRIAYIINMLWAILVLFGLWPPVAVFLGLGTGCCLCPGPTLCPSTQQQEEGEEGCDRRRSISASSYAAGAAANEGIDDDDVNAYPSAAATVAVEDDGRTLISWFRKVSSGERAIAGGGSEEERKNQQAAGSTLVKAEDDTQESNRADKTAAVTTTKKAKNKSNGKKKQDGESSPLLQQRQEGGQAVEEGEAAAATASANNQNVSESKYRRASIGSGFCSLGSA